MPPDASSVRRTRTGSCSDVMSSERTPCWRAMDSTCRYRRNGSSRRRIAVIGLPIVIRPACSPRASDPTGAIMSRPSATAIVKIVPSMNATTTMSRVSHPQLVISPARRTALTQPTTPARTSANQLRRAPSRRPPMKVTPLIAGTPRRSSTRRSWRKFRRVGESDGEVPSASIATVTPDPFAVAHRRGDRRIVGASPRPPAVGQEACGERGFRSAVPREHDRVRLDVCWTGRVGTDGEVALRGVRRSRPAGAS